MHKFHESLTLINIPHVHMCLFTLLTKKNIRQNKRKLRYTNINLTLFLLLVCADGVGGLIEKKAAASCLHSH